MCCTPISVLKPDKIAPPQPIEHQYNQNLKTHQTRIKMRLEVASVKEIPDMHSMGHTCANLNGDLLFVWGGTNDNASYIAIKNSSIWIYETLTGYWRHRVCSGECPPYLSSCSSCLIGQKMFIFGGHSTLQDNWMNGLYCLDLETFIWSDLGSQAQAQPTKPIRSDKNVSWSFRGKLYVFGGYGWSQVEHYLELLDCQKDLQLTPDHRWPKFGWNNQLVEYSPSERTWLWPNYSGKCPSARAAHSGALMGDLYYIFGGRDSHERLNDLYTLDMRTLDWQQVAVISSDPASQLYRSIEPLRHLLDVSRDDNGEEVVVGGGEQMAAIAATAAAAAAAAAPGASEVSSTNYVTNNDDDLALDENHRQIVEEMHGVDIEEEDDDVTRRWDPSVPSSSSLAPLPVRFAADISPASNLIEQRDKRMALSDSKLFEGFDDDDEDDFEYPHPSHLLERWSLSSNNDDNMNNTAANCLQDQTRSEQQQATLNPTAPTQNILLFNNLHLDHHNSHQHHHHHHHAHELDVTGTATTNTQQSQQPLEEHDSNSQDINQQQSQPQEPHLINNPMQLQSPAPSPAPDGDDNQDHVAAAEASIDVAAAATTSTSQQLPLAQLPTGRSFCSLTPISDDNMLLFGGVNSQDQNLDDCWLFNVKINQWSRIDYKHKLLRPRLWHTGSRTKQNEVVILGGSCSEKIDEYCSDVLVLSFEPKSLKRLALDAVSRSVRMKAIQKTKGLPSTLLKLIRLRKQAMALTTYHRPMINQQS